MVECTEYRGRGKMDLDLVYTDAAEYVDYYYYYEVLL